MTDPIDWTLVTVAPNTEPKVKAALERHEFPHHMFRHQETIIRLGRRVPILRFTFPRYAFVSRELWRPIADRIDQVVGPVRFGDTIAQLPDGVVDELVASCIGPDILPAIAKAARFAPGETVVIDGTGPMAGQSGVYLKPTVFGRCQIELPVFGRVELAEDSLRLAGAIVAARRKRYRKRPSQRRRYEISGG